MMLTIYKNKGSLYLRCQTNSVGKEDKKISSQKYYYSHNCRRQSIRWQSILVQDQQRKNYSKFMTILGDVSPYSKVVLMLNEASQYTWQVIWQFQFYLQTIVDLVLWLSNPSLSWLVFYNWFLEGFRSTNFGSELIALILYIVKLSLQRGSVLEARER